MNNELILIKLLTSTEYRILSYIRTVDFRYTAFEVAEYLNISIKTVYKTLKDLKEMQLITKHYKGELLKKIEQFNGTPDEYFNNKLK